MKISTRRITLDQRIKELALLISGLRYRVCRYEGLATYSSILNVTAMGVYYSRYIVQQEAGLIKKIGAYGEAGLMRSFYFANGSWIAEEIILSLEAGMMKRSQCKSKQDL